MHSTKEAVLNRVGFSFGSTIEVPGGRPYRRNQMRQYRSRIAANHRVNQPCKTFSNRRRTSYQKSVAPPYRDCIDLGLGPEVGNVCHLFLTETGTINSIEPEIHFWEVIVPRS